MPELNTWQFTPLALPQAIAALLAFAASLLVWRRRRESPLSVSLWPMLLSNTLWAGAGALEFLAATPAAKIFFSQLSYLGIVAGPITLLYFSHAYVHAGARPPRILTLVACLLASVILAAAWTNGSHGLLWPEVVPVERDGFLYVRYERGPFFWLTVVYCYGFLLRSSVLLIYKTLRIGGVFSRQSLLILFASLAPWAASVCYVLRIGPMPELDHTPVGFAASGILLSLGVLRFRLFDLAPISADTLFNRIPDPVLVVDHAGSLIRANRAGLERFGLSTSSFGERVETALSKSPGLAAAFRGAQGLGWRKILADGESWWEIESGPLNDDSPRAGARLLILRDITEQKRSELLLAEALERAESLRREADNANAAKSTFLAQVSHDLRTPLHAILGLSELMLAQPLDATMRADLSTVRDAGGILLRLINDLLDLSRIEAGRIDLVHEPFLLSELAGPVMELLAVKAREKKLELAHTLDPALPAMLCGDAERLRQILFNLGGNAVKFTQAGSVSIALRLEAAPEPRLCIAVADTGPGIPASRLPTIFEPFDRGDRKAVERIEGTGLGLAISRRLAEAMGGALTVESQPGKGATFTLSLPVRDAHAAIELRGLRTVLGNAPGVAPIRQMPVRGAHGHRMAGLRVLLADDQEISQRVSGALLQAYGCLVETVNDGSAVAGALRSARFDLLVLDGQMHDMNGWDVARLVREGGAGDEVRHLPILALTADLSAEARQRWQDAGADLVLGKPSSLDSLAEAISRVRAKVGMGV